MWSELLTALALMLVFEGLLPFLNPDGYKRYVAQIALLSSNNLRWFGLGSMIVGCCLLLFFR